MAQDPIGYVVRGTVGWDDKHGQHWQAYTARCAECRRVLWPTLAAPPTAEWRCGVCRTEQGATSRTRRAAMTPERTAALVEAARKARLRKKSVPYALGSPSEGV